MHSNNGSTGKTEKVANWFLIIIWQLYKDTQLKEAECWNKSCLLNFQHKM